jgi:GABA permease
MRMWGFPYVTYFALIVMVLIVAAMAFIPEQRAPLVFGIVSVLVMLGGYWLRGLLRR